MSTILTDGNVEQVVQFAEISLQQSYPDRASVSLILGCEYQRPEIPRHPYLTGRRRGMKLQIDRQGPSTPGQGMTAIIVTVASIM
jgi:hypothetical protein